MTTGRRRSRREALFALYQRDLLERDPAAVLSDLGVGGRAEEPEQGGDPYRRRLIEGVLAHLEEIDRVLAAQLEGWSLDRLAPLERNILRVGVFELRWAPDVPEAVAVAEAVTLAKRYCSDEAARLVNGVLGALTAP